MVLGVDGGGTKTMTVCLDKEKNVIGQFASACSNHNSVGPELAREAIHAGITGALSAAGKTVNDGLYYPPLFTLLVFLSTHSTSL